MATPSKDAIKTELNRSLDQSLSKLQQIWVEIGIGEAQQRERTNTVLIHLRNLLDEMVQEEESLKAQIMEKVAKFAEEVLTLCKELGLPEYEPKDSLSVLLLEKDLKAKMDALSKEKADRLKLLKKLKDQDQHLCDIMCLTPYYIPTGTIPSGDQLQALEKHVNALTNEKEKRYKEFVVMKKGVVHLFLEMDRNPDTDFERDLVCEEDDSFLLSTENMDALKDLQSELEVQKSDRRKMIANLWERVNELWERLNIPEEEKSQLCKDERGSIKQGVLDELNKEIARLEKMKFENIQKFVEGTRRELISWWDKCYYSKLQRDAFKPFVDENYTEELLEVHDREMQNVKNYFEKHKELLEKVTRREQLFEKMLEFERKASDPNRFNNRGGGLLQEEKARKKLMKELPKLEDELKDLILAWERENNCHFLIDGCRFIEYVEHQYREYNQKKVSEKEQRHKAKAKLMEEELKFGSKPETPAKRRFIGTPTRTPTSKIRRVDDTDSVSIELSIRLKTPVNKKNQRRRSNRLARKALAERNNGGVTNETSLMFSHTTVRSCGTSAGDISVASTGTYQDFAHGIEPYGRSSIMPHSSPGKK